MKIKSKNEDDLPEQLRHDELARIERNFHNLFQLLDSRMESMERTMRQLSHHVASFEDALTYYARIPNHPLDLEYDHKTNTLWAETRRKLEFNKNEAVILALMFSKSTGKPKSQIFHCSEVADKLKNSGEGIESGTKVFETAKRVQKKLDEFLNTNEALVVTTKSFYFSKITLS